jgi:hypothetical protein
MAALARAGAGDPRALHVCERVLSARSGDELFDVVSTYASLGHHRTGSAVDQTTAGWLTHELRTRGLDVRADSVAFDGWRGDAKVHVDDRVVESLAVPYEWEGSIDTTNVAVVDLQQGLGGDSSVLAEPVRAAKAAGHDAVVCATRHSKGALVGINRDLRDAPLDIPVFLVAGDELTTLSSSVVRVTATAQRVPAKTKNLIATNGGSGGRLMLTTPLNGWFGCAGERGTGIAVLLDLVGRLVGEKRVLVVLTGGHELGYFGARAWASSNPPELREVRSILHLGASVAVESNGSLIAQRVALTSVPSQRCAPIHDALVPIGLELNTAPTRWVGEGEIWQQLGPPLLSTSGAGVDFHTPNDHAERVTSPAALLRVADAFAAVALSLD